MSCEGTIVIADDTEGDLAMLRRMLEEAGYAVHLAQDGAAALDRVMSVMPDLLVSDVMMPRLNGFELCRSIKKDPTTRLTPVVLVTGLDSTEDRIEGIKAGADDFLTKPVHEGELLARASALVRLKRCTDELDSAEAVIMSLAQTIETRDHCTAGHSDRMARLAVALGARLKLDDSALTALRRGAYLHDVGKIGVPDAILLKDGPLTHEELTIMREHAVMGDRLCGSLRLLTHVRPIVRHHHEHLDGSGYPDGLKGDAVPVLAQIIGVVDVYDALTSDRPYRARIAPDAACSVLEKEARLGWRSPALVAEFIHMVQESPAMA